MRSSKQLFFFFGIATQVVVLCISFFFLHDVHQKGGSDLEGEMFSSMDMQLQHQSSSSLQMPFNHSVTGEGRVLPSSGYIEITPGVKGEVIDVNVAPGDYVKEGDLLFRIDDAEYRFSLKEKIAEYDASLAALHLIQEGPSPIALQVKEKEIEKAQIKVARSEEECSIFRTLLESDAVTKNENQEKSVQHAMFSKELEKILAEYAGLQEVVSNSEVEIRQAHVKREEANVAAVERKLRRCHAHAPISGQIFSVGIHRGKHVSSSDRNTIVIGSDNPLHLKVHIDESQAWRISPSKNLRAIAVHKSNPKLHFILTYVSLTPLLEKRENGERKLELVFSFDKGKSPIYLEEMLDVYIEAASPADTACLDYQFSQQR